MTKVNTARNIYSLLWSSEGEVDTQFYVWKRILAGIQRLSITIKMWIYVTASLNTFSKSREKSL
jgi:hypothetical protein